MKLKGNVTIVLKNGHTKEITIKDSNVSGFIEDVLGNMQRDDLLRLVNFDMIIRTSEIAMVYRNNSYSDGDKK